ncbi:MAG: NAD kinase [Lactobacillaceae bacterium]|jgi:NAD+ kinase|nr:NAD kinase [Lactobacillaceae bacterium]
MKVAIYKNDVEHTVAVAKELEYLLQQHSDTVQIDVKHPEVVISVGGDGTLLSAFHHYAEFADEVRFVGVHTGHLGFYADWQHFELEALVESLLADEGRTVKYPLLEMTVRYKTGAEEKVLAVNEAAIKRPQGTLVADVFIDGERFERFRGDGLTAATPTGSTAYNKANGGAVLHPSLESIQLSEIASINNRVFRTLGSPLVVGPNQVIRIGAIQSDAPVTLSYDHLNIMTKEIAWVEFRVAKATIAFAEYRHTPFWHRVHNSFIGDEVE